MDRVELVMPAVRPRDTMDGRIRARLAETLTLMPTADPRVFVAPDGRRLSPPAGWACLPPGDAALTRRVKQAGASWADFEKRGRKAFSRGLWAPAETIERIRAELATERDTEAYARRRVADVARRERTQAAYPLCQAVDEAADAGPDAAAR